MNTAHHSTCTAPATSGITSASSHPDQLFERAGITFAIYGADESMDRLIPLDLIPFITEANQPTGLATGTMLSLNAQPGSWETFAYFAA